MNSKIRENCEDFLSENNIGFEELIRCYNYWSQLNGEEKGELINLYSEGAFRGIRSY